MSEILIYTAADGRIEIDVNIAEESVWLSLTQIAQLFKRDKSVVSRHINNIFKVKELEKKSVIAKFATAGPDGKIYQVDYYNLDVIISVGYRVNSKEGVRFRKWATQVLKDHIIRGYSIYEKRLAEHGINELQQAIKLLSKTLIQQEMVNDIGSEAIQIILSYSKTWSLLLAYDEGRLALPKKGRIAISALDYKKTVDAISALKAELYSRKEASPLFGNERDHGFYSILRNIEQTFDGEQLYKSIEEKSANLLYFIIKDHPFTDGNKRIGCFIFLLYLKMQKIPIKLNENGLVALALLISESDPSQKDTMVKLIINIIVNLNQY